jgi:hypothetical protein
MHVGSLLANLTKPSRGILSRSTTAPVASSPATLQLFLPRSIPSSAFGMFAIYPLLCFQTQAASDAEGGPSIKTLIASAQDRPDVARRRAQWLRYPAGSMHPA